MRAEPAGGLTGGAAEAGQVVTLSLFRFPSLYDKHWALWQMLLARRALHRLPGVQFMRMVGTGSREGFFPWPNFGVYGLLAAWPSLDHARAQIAAAAPYRRYRAHASEHVDFYLQATRSRGAWGGHAPFAIGARDDPDASVAVLTRAAIKPAKLLAFWARTPAIRATIPGNAGLPFKIGLGEAPWLNQITFTVWRDRRALRTFAYAADGPHGAAADAARERGWFREELFARFRIAAVEGRWEGRALDDLAAAPLGAAA